MTVAILKAMRDVSYSNIGSDIVYYSMKEPLEDDRVLKSKTGNYIGRDFVCCERVSDTLKDFLCSRPGQDSSRAKKLEPGDICSAEEKELGFEIKAFEVDHSIYGATAYILYGDSAIAYTGDIRTHGRYGNRTEEFVKNAKNASVLIVECTRAVKIKFLSEKPVKDFDKDLRICRRLMLLGIEK